MYFTEKYCIIFGILVQNFFSRLTPRKSDHDGRFSFGRGYFCSFQPPLEAYTQKKSELELELILSRWLWEREEEGGASLQNQARVRAQCGVMQ